MFEFTPWKKFQAQKQPKTVRRWLKATGTSAVDVFRKGMTGSHSGRKYARLPNRSSAAGEYPATQSGRLLRSIKSREKLNNATIAPLVGEVVVGTGTFYARFLRNGTKKMARRKMSDNALSEGAPKTEKEIIGWVKWIRR